MKTSERHHLKQNELAMSVGQVADSLAGHQRTILAAAAAILVIAVAVGGYWVWKKQRDEKAAALLAAARTAATAPVESTSPLPTINDPTPAAGGYKTEAERDQAALKKFQEAAAAYPSTTSGIAAQYQAASLLAEMGKLADAEKAFADVVSRDGNGLYGRMSRLGIAALQLRSNRVDPAIQTLQELSQRTDTDMPVDAILMQLGDAYQRANRTAEAVRAYTRIVNEFPESAYVSDARAEADKLKAQPAAR